MSNTLLISLAVLGILGGVLAVILYFVAQKFKVEENPMIDEVEAFAWRQLRWLRLCRLPCLGRGLREASRRKRQP